MQEGRRAAQGLPHAFAWDMELCLTALGIGALDEARAAARAAHRQNPQYRAALRYLVALDLLSGDTEAAAQATDHLRRFEPGFMTSDLSRSDYPMLTLRKLGYASALPG